MQGVLELERRIGSGSQHVGYMQSLGNKTTAFVLVYSMKTVLSCTSLSDQIGFQMHSPKKSVGAMLFNGRWNRFNVDRKLAVNIEVCNTKTV
jgi:hypothetical protein